MARYELAGRTVVITGATGGLGQALAADLRRRGANLALVDLDTERVQEQAQRLGGATVAAGITADVRDADSVKAGLDQAAEHFGRLDVVVAAAGVTAMAPMASMSPEVFDRVVDINLGGVWRTFRAALPHVADSRGYLLAVSSMAAFVHSPLQGPYVASKAGVWALADATRLELRHLGVGVGSAHPTFIKTPMMEDLLADPAGDRLWGGNASGLWKMVPLDEVVGAIASGIERRAPMIVAPRRLSLPARVPGLLRPLVDVVGLPGRTIPDATVLAGDGSGGSRGA